MKTGLILLLMACAVTGAGFSMARKPQEAASQEISRQVTVTGLVGVYGNEPHTWLGFVDQQGTDYGLDGPAELLESLRTMQGILLRITGQLRQKPTDDPIHPHALAGGIIYIESIDHP